MKKIFVLLLCFSTQLIAQESTFRVNGPANKIHTTYAFKHARIFSDYQTVMENATLIIRDGVVVSAGVQSEIPSDAVVFDMQGKTIYPGFIDLYTTYGTPVPPKAKYPDFPQFESATKGAYAWNQALKPEVDASRVFTYNNDYAESLRSNGFSAALSFVKDGIARGTSVLTTLSDGRDNSTIIFPRAAAHYSFEKGSSTQQYPSSLTGAIALLRQTFLDAEWYKNDKTKKEVNLSLEAWNSNMLLPQIFEVNDKYSVLRADKIGDEFNVQYVIKGSGDEYQRINEIKQTNASLIVPLNFPVALDVEDPFNALNASLEDLKHWEMAPVNPAVLEKNGINFAITSADLKDRKEFLSRLQKAVEYGLSEKQALKALTATPAEMLKAQDKIGSLKPGMLANFIITSGNIFEKKSVIFENWIQGKPFKVNDYTRDISGHYTLNAGPYTLELKIAGEPAKPSATMIRDTMKIKSGIQIADKLINLSFDPKDHQKQGMVRLDGLIEIAGTTASMTGKGQLQNGEWVTWNATYKSALTEAEKKDTTAKQLPVYGEVTYPFGSFGWKEMPAQGAYLIKNATVWTCEEKGILKNTDVLIEKGKITRIGKNLNSAGAVVVDGTNKHVSPGIIDEHSHIAIAHGVNEGTHALSSEVRMGDVIDPDDVDIYRQLSGGVTTSQLLHGSANPVGGQSAIIKLRWGFAPEKMNLEQADGFIKFALGENVKQSNWGDQNVIRYPQTRMGVEQTYYDAFIRAKEYEKKMKEADGKGKTKGGQVVRRDLQLEPLVEILNNKRFITCHSYVQSEINMLMHVADSMDFKVNTFTHILEGYKVADKMKAHGAGASTFSDWWAYKMEVQDAIPYNASIMSKNEIVTAINSDDAEMGRRLNQEAAKIVKYGKVSEEDALKMVTLNPAKLLHLDHRMGSLKEGKDADVVVWSDNPLSIYAKAEKTFVDGRLMYDVEQDKVLRALTSSERNRIIQKLLKEKAEGGATKKPEIKGKRHYHCDTMLNNYKEE